MFGIKPKTLHHWYKESLSGYKHDVASGLWGEKKITIADEGTGEIVKKTCADHLFDNFPMLKAAYELSQKQGYGTMDGTSAKI